jgi:hypothetical protein
MNATTEVLVKPTLFSDEVGFLAFLRRASDEAGPSAAVDEIARHIIMTDSKDGSEIHFDILWPRPDDCGRYGMTLDDYIAAQTARADAHAARKAEQAAEMQEARGAALAGAEAYTRAVNVEIGEHD